MFISDSYEISISNAVDNCWKKTVSPCGNQLKLTTTDVSIFAVWIVAAMGNLNVYSIELEKNFSIAIGKNGNVLFKISSFQKLNNSEKSYKINNTNYYVNLHENIDFDIKLFVLLEKAVEIASFIKYRLDSILLLPRELRIKNLENELLNYNISIDTFNSLVKNYSLLEKFLN